MTSSGNHKISTHWIHLLHGFNYAITIEIMVRNTPPMVSLRHMLRCLITSKKNFSGSILGYQCVPRRGGYLHYNFRIPSPTLEGLHRATMRYHCIGFIYHAVTYESVPSVTYDTTVGSLFHTCRNDLSWRARRMHVHVNKDIYTKALGRLR
jgi:hypothetical protein